MRANAARSMTPSAGTARTDSSVLVVDDEPGMRNLIDRWLRAAGYGVAVAASAEEALAAQAMAPSAVAVCDIHLPDRDGVWLVDHLRQRYPATAVIMATGMPDVDTAVAGLRNGVVDYLRKPFTREQVCRAAKRGVERHRAVVGAAGAPQTASAANGERQPGAFAARSPGFDGLLASSKADAASERARRVGALATVLAGRLGIPEPGLSVIGRAARSYVLGSGNRSRRPALGHGGAGTRDVVDEVTAWFRSGSSTCGVPAAAISPGSRVVAVADTYDAITRPRADAPAKTPTEALAVIRATAGDRFDPRVVTALAETLGVRHLRSKADALPRALTR